METKNKTKQKLFLGHKSSIKNVVVEGGKYYFFCILKNSPYENNFYKHERARNKNAKCKKKTKKKRVFVVVAVSCLFLRTKSNI